MFFAVSTKTMAGARQRAAQRAQAIQRPSAAILPFKRPQAVPEPREVPPAVKEAKHRAFALSIKPASPTSALQIIEQVARWHGIGTKDILSENRARHITAARQDAIAAVYLNCWINGRRYNLPDLGRLFGRDHKTVHYALRKRGLA